MLQMRLLNYYRLVSSSSLPNVCRHRLDQNRYRSGSLYFSYYVDLSVSSTEVQRRFCRHSLIEEDHSF